MKDIFKTEDGHVLDLNKWQKYTEKKDFEKKYYSEYFKIVIPQISQYEISIGVFYELMSDQTHREHIHHIAWGLRKEKDCSYNATVRDNKYIENIVAGCPCEEVSDVKNCCKIEKPNYFPLFLFLTITILASLLYSYFFTSLNVMNFMSSYMAFFFLIFGILKISNLKKFSKMFATYDLVAKKIPTWGYIYPYVEVLLGFSYLFFSYFYLLNIFTAILMGITSLGIYKHLRSGVKTDCACLGGYFNIPLSWITFFENFTMFLMAIYMLLM